MIVLLALLGSAALAPVSEARTIAADSVLRLDSLYAMVDARSPMLRAANAAARAADARIGPTTRLPDPQLQIASMNRQLPGFGLDPVLGMNQVQLMQMIPLGGRLGHSAEVARGQARAASAEAAETRLTQRAAVARQFFALYRLDRSLQVAEESRDVVRRLLATAEGMYRVGRGRQADLLRAQVEVARMGEEITRMRAMRVAEGARLNGLLDRPGSDTLPTPELPALTAVLPSVDSLVTLARATRPMLAAATSRVEAAKAEEARAKGEMWPDLTVGVVYGQRRMETETDRMLSLMVGATVPLWAGSRQKQMQQEAGAMREMAEADASAIKAETGARVVEIVAEVDRTRRLMALYRQTILPQAVATVNSSLSAYQVGTVDFMTVLDNQMTVNRYRTELVGLTAELGTVLAELEMVTATRWFGTTPATSAGEHQP
jgi:outer membrane protein TolC